ncbi:carboxymuconolactone decarboxylase family protein [Psychrobium sp. MM17-31]|uniref:carboxymuconolactone decarboxylase family protein n=1 Tax=Psychrobium sp. MM17-31 TaxID=2917758 RepID=UPI001EF4CECB|nr:carboxymuconolactone decarboxylase family protein [Psychrobium sp. MM17-31]MCG7532140.1 carboxymuconolactone decarboxylase family protein [Psychrobium sp. MM17-31]
MSFINTPDTINDAPKPSQESLRAVHSMLGSVPNMFRLISNSPQTLQGYLGLNGALSNGTLSPQTRESIALAVAQLNSCNYCLAAHHFLGTNLAKLSESEIAANRRGSSNDPQIAAAVAFATQVVKKRGQVSPEDRLAVRQAGFTDAQLLEIVGHVALNTLTNYVNEVFETQIDFPQVEAL